MPVIAIFPNFDLGRQRMTLVAIVECLYRASLNICRRMSGDNLYKITRDKLPCVFLTSIKVAVSELFHFKHCVSDNV